jgi:hypothetical protein
MSQQGTLKSPGAIGRLRGGRQIRNGAKMGTSVEHSHPNATVEGRWGSGCVGVFWAEKIPDANSDGEASLQLGSLGCRFWFFPAIS